MKLFIDDIRNAPDESWNVVRTVGAAIRAIARFENEITEISLDHDISHQVSVGDLSRPYPCEETFQPVAHFFCLQVAYYQLSKDKAGVEYPIWWPKINIHSANPVGAADMKKIFDDFNLPCSIKMMGVANRLETEIK